jgi:flagellar hook-associated protein 3 FlgL
MRVTDKSMSNNSLNGMQLNLEKLVKLQQQASSGLKINAPGDDPAGAQQALQLKGTLQDNQQYARNIVTGTAWLGQTDNIMSSMGDVVARAHEIAMQMSTGSVSAENRTGAIPEVTQLTAQMVQLGNTQVGGKYIFGGFKNDVPPFDSTGTFTGTTEDLNVQTGLNSQVAMNYSGSKLLKGDGTTGTVDVFTALQDFSTALSKNDQAGVQTALTALDTAQSQITAARADVGSRMNRMENASTNLDSMNIVLNKDLTGTQDADILKVYSELTNQQTAYQASLTSTSKISQLSLLNYLK